MKYLGVKISDDLNDRILATNRPKSEVVRDALAAYFSIESAPVNKEDLIALIDERIKFNVDKTNIKPGVKSTLNTDKIDMGHKLNDSKTNVKPILEAIKSYHDRGEEPLVSEVAELVGMETRPMGVLLKKHGIEATSTRRDGQPGRYFTFDLRDRIGELLSGGGL